MCLVKKGIQRQYLSYSCLNACLFSMYCESSVLQKYSFLTDFQCSSIVILAKNRESIFFNCYALFTKMFFDQGGGKIGKFKNIYEIFNRQYFHLVLISYCKEGRAMVEEQFLKKQSLILWIEFVIFPPKNLIIILIDFLYFIT